MTVYNDVEKSVALAYGTELLKHQEAALKAATRAAKHYGFNEEDAERFAEHMAERALDKIYRRA